MRTLLVTGGTDGIGRSLVLSHLRRGDRVLTVGRTADKGAALLRQAAELGAADRLTFLSADLSTIAENDRVVAYATSVVDRLDGLVFCARHYRSHRTVTTDGLESTFALFYLSRFLLAFGLLPLLERSDRPVVVNVAGPGADLAVVRWDDLQLERDYHGGVALGQGGKLNDLLGVAFARRHGTAVPTVLVHPGVTSTGFSGDYDSATAAQIRVMQEQAKPVDAAAAPILQVLAEPPAVPLSALVEGRPVAVGGPQFGVAAAELLHAITRDLLDTGR